MENKAGEIGGRQIMGVLCEDEFGMVSAATIQYHRLVRIEQHDQL